MQLTQLQAILVVLVFFSLGDLIASKTKALMSMRFISSALILAAFWMGMPADLFQKTGLMNLAMTFIPVLMVHMGTMIDGRAMLAQYKTVIIALLTMCAASAAVILIGSPLIGMNYALTATGPISGGNVAMLIMSAAAQEKGLNDILVFVTMLLILQSFVGVPIASFCLRREARRLRAEFAAGAQAAAAAAEKTERKKLIPPLPKKLRTPFILLCKSFLVAALAVAAAKLTGNKVHPFVMALVFGVLAYELGFLEGRILEVAASSGLSIFIMLLPTYVNLSKATPQMVASLLFPIVVSFAAAVVGLIVSSLIISKIAHTSFDLTLAIGSCCLIGFPGTFIVSDEVARNMSDSEEEHKFIESRIMPQMLVSGFTTVTIASVFLAGFLVNFM
ncbi:MAG: hypothetical protein IJ233_04955 [Pyramidobacter sp.]|nr:hypothetical protein [Pyramidobacter sp.]